MGKPSKFKDKVGADNAREKARGSNYGHLILPRGIKMFQVKGGERVRLDFLPYVVSDPNHPCRNDEADIATVGTQWYRRPYKLHRNIGANNDSAVCLASIGKKCPICEHRAALVKKGKSDEDELKALKASDRNLYAVVPIGHKEYDEVVHVFDISRFNFQDMLREETDEKPEFRAFFDPSEDGFTVNIRFSEEQLGKNKFAAASRIDFEERRKGEGYDDEFLESVPDLDKMLTILSYKELEDKFLELDEEDAETEANESEEKEPPRRRRTEVREEESEEEETKRPARRHARRSEESEESEETDHSARKRRQEREEEQEEDRPRRSRQSETKENDEHDEDNEDENDDEPKSNKTKGDLCVACQGEGQDTRGRVCPICKGSGKKKKVAEPEEEKSSGKKSTKKDSECPHGHDFGKDCDKYAKHCTDCPVWDACLDAQG